MNRKPLRSCQTILVDGNLMTVGDARRANLLKTTVITLQNGNDVIIKYDNVYEVLR